MVDGRRTRWWSGTRLAFVTNLNASIPPVVKLCYNDKDFTVSVWHFGQTHMKCRWCHNVVEKTHECDRRPKRRCHNCGKEDHVKADCPSGRVCYVCRGKDHIARDCPQQAYKDGTAALHPRGSREQRPHPPEGNVEEATQEPSEFPKLPTEDTTNIVGSTQPPEEQPSNVTMNTESIDNVSSPLSQNVSNDNRNDALMRTILIGTSNCRGLTLSGDDSMVVENALLSQGGLSIGEAHEKLEEVSTEKLKKCDTVIIHVGSCDFPVQSERKMNENYANYVELLDHVSTKCPQAHVLISSILPRGGDNRESVNGQIHKFNSQLSQLSCREDMIEFVDNDVHFFNDSEVIKELFKGRDATGIHINDVGRARLEASFLQSVKEICFKRKLENEWSIS